MHDHLEKVFSPATLAGLPLRNRLIKAATSEGMTPGGVPRNALADFHARISEGGIGMTTLAYCAVEPDGRLYEHQMHMHEAIAPQLRALADRVHGAGAKLCGQMTHAGGFIKNRNLSRKRPLGPSRGFNKYGAAQGLVFCDAMSTQDMDDLVQAYGVSAQLMAEIGFDALFTSGGSSSGNPMMLFHGDSIAGPLLKAEPNPMMRLAMRVASPFMFKDYPYKPFYFRGNARRVRDAVGCAVAYVGGAASSEEFASLMADGFDLIQLGRALLADPDLPKEAALDLNWRSRCIHCNECVGTIEAPGGVRCVRV